MSNETSISHMKNFECFGEPVKDFWTGLKVVEYCGILLSSK